VRGSIVKALYICYFGVREPLVQTQVLPYLRELQKPDPGTTGGSVDITLLTFEPDIDFDSDSVRDELATNGIRWNWLRYHKRPSSLATSWDVFRGALYIFTRKREYEILHARSHVPMLMAVVARKFSGRRTRVLFDIRGFMPEEYVDAALWKSNGPMFRLAKVVERWLMKEADGTVVLTRRAKRVLLSDGNDSKGQAEGSLGAPAAQVTGPIEVIPCCVDFENRFSIDARKYRGEIRSELKINNRFVVVYVGAIGGPYRTEEIADFLAAARRYDDSTFAIFLTQSNLDLILPLLASRGFGKEHIFAGRVPPAEVSKYLAAGDAGLSFVKSGYAALSRSPTKIPEYLACGVPIIANSGVGDVDELVDEYKVGALVKEFTTESYAKALNEIVELGDISDRCREVARREFDLEAVGGIRYRRLYKELTKST